MVSYAHAASTELFDDMGRHDISITSYKPTYLGMTTFHNDKGTMEEIKFQVSLKYELLEDSGLFLGYTQKSFWSVQNTSAPFRASEFSPEIFYLWEVFDYADDHFLKYIQFGIYAHESTGEAGDLSQTLHYSYIEPTFRLGDFMLSIKAMNTFLLTDVSVSAEPNPDIFDYRGFFEGRLVYTDEMDTQHSLIMRYYEPEERYSVEYQWDVDLDYIWYMLGSDKEANWNPKLFFQYFNGYGESINSYDSITKRITVGFSLIR